jgi:RNA methyltransferase, RsmE family
MTRRRWIADEVNGETASLTGEHAVHLARVLRAKVGQEFDIVVPSGNKGDVPSDLRRGTITAISDSRVEFSLGEKLQKETASIPQITLALAIFKFDRMEWAIEKCTEIGVTRMIPLIARRSDAHLVGAASKRHERWLRITKQAAEQSRRAAAPEITSPMKLQDLAEALPAFATRLVLAETLVGSQETGLTNILQSSSTAEAILAVGPEGGWTEDELAWFHDAGWIAASLGPTILRTETAAIVASALAIDALR